MSREIKFRAWDGDRLIGFGDLMCRQGHLDAFINTIAETTAANNPSGPKYNLMQYTGLKDKNGVEIYEGDIIAYDERDNIAKVQYLHAGFYLNFKQNITQLLHDNRIEVIGNIYEHSHLLENESKEL